MASLIEKVLNLSLANAQWIIDGYMIAAASLMAFAGRLSNIYGIRIIFLSGAVAFAVTSLMVGLSINSTMVIIQ